MTRRAILGHSLFAGLLLGVFAGTASLGVLVLGVELAGVAPAIVARWRPAVLVAALVVLPVVGAVFGWLEGRGKLE